MSTRAEPSQPAHAAQSTGDIAARASGQAGFFFKAAFVVIVAATARFLFINRFEIWLDEAYCFSVAHKSITGILADLRLDNGPPLYYMSLHYWMRIFGESEAALRSLSAVLSTAAVLVLVTWDTPWFSRRGRLLAGFILAITPLDIYYAQEARMYAPVTFLVVVSMVLLERGLRLGRMRDWSFFAVFTALALYTSYVAVFLVPVGYAAILVELAVTRRRGQAARKLVRLVSAHAAAALLFLPWLPTFVAQPSGKATQWIRPMWQGSHKTLLPFQSLSLMTTGGAYYPKYLTNLYQGPGRRTSILKALETGQEKGALLSMVSRIQPEIPLITMAFVAACAVFVALRPPDASPYRLLLVSWVLLSFAVPIALSFLRPMFIVGRYELTGVPAFAVIVGIGFSRMRVAGRASCVAVGILLFLYTWTYAQSWSRVDVHRAKAAVIARTASAGDVVFCTAFEYATAYYYAGPARDSLAWVTCPRDTVNHSAWIDFDRWLAPGWKAPSASLEAEAANSLAEAVMRTPPGQALIVVRPPRPPERDRVMDSIVESAIKSAVESGTLIMDGPASAADIGVLVFRRPA